MIQDLLKGGGAKRPGVWVPPWDLLWVQGKNPDEDTGATPSPYPRELPSFGGFLNTFWAILAKLDIL